MIKKLSKIFLNKFIALSFPFKDKTSSNSLTKEDGTNILYIVSLSIFLLLIVSFLILIFNDENSSLNLFKKDSKSFPLTSIFVKNTFSSITFLSSEA